MDQTGIERTYRNLMPLDRLQFGVECNDVKLFVTRIVGQSRKMPFAIILGRFGTIDPVLAARLVHRRDNFAYCREDDLGGTGRWWIYGAY